MMAQTNERLEAKQFAVETLESLQKLCPMSMAVTLRHFAAVYHAVRTGVLAAALKAQLNIVFLHGFCAVATLSGSGLGLTISYLHTVLGWLAGSVTGFRARNNNSGPRIRTDC